MSCNNCNVNLAGVEYVEKDDKDLCISCFNLLFGKTCTKCQMLIPAGTKFATNGGKFWHKDCFQCFSCKKKLTKFDIGDDEQFYCHACHKEKYGPKCIVCHNGIVKSLRYVENEGHLFHEDCFRCSSKTCGKKLDDGFIPKDNQFFCQECYREIESKHTFKETFTFASLIFTELVPEEDKILKSMAQSFKTELTSKIQPIIKTLNIPRVSKENLFFITTDQTQTISYLFPNIIMNTTVSNGSIQLRSGDLAKQKVDVIVVCSTSEILLKNILQQAGVTVANEYHRLSTSVNPQDSIIETGPGNLSCQAILFYRWTPPTDRNKTKLLTSISEYVSKLLGHILNHKKVYRTAAFPPVEYGLSQCPLDTIAEAMINTAVTKLAETLLYFTISFIILPNEFNVHQKFAEKLASIQKQLEPFGHVEYSLSQINLTLTAKQETNLKQCGSAIRTYMNTCTQIKSHENDDLNVWTQQLVMNFYQHCLNRHIWPMINLEQKKLTLTGKKESIDAADRHFLELTNQALKQLHLKNISRNVVWEYQIDATTWQSYSYNCIGEIEYARTIKNLPTIEITNEQDELCQINFANSTETFNDRIRAIRQRHLISVRLPNHWQCQSGNFCRFLLNEDTDEYKNVKQLFDQTMANLYVSIKSIERIQNQRWYKQYTAHHEAMSERLKENIEKRLFHGCTETAANSIVEECFNRSFAGINGTVYGRGAYFAANANYSHQYALPNANGDRYMFVVSVLVGKSTLGNTSMKVPPSGYDSTTDNRQIFVVYHDAQAYADYLITYQ
ncbi:hypothetical protein I4U23_002361 [Adineta vaga]|nr:hypothetical protein I4U23_002361 [Adineta vaga]